MPEQQIQPRQTAHKVCIKDLFNGVYVQQEGWLPNYIQVLDKQVSRINLIATVIDKQTFDSLITISLDDGTGVIQAKTFNEDTKKLQNINIGDFILLIGRPRRYNEQLFLTIEIIKKIPPVWGKVRKIELEKVNKQDDSGQENDRQKLFSIIKKLDTGQGADISEVLKMLNPEKGEAVINNLLKLGEIYENRPGYIKTID